MILALKTVDINKEPEVPFRVVCGLMFVDDIRLGCGATIRKKDEKGLYEQNEWDRLDREDC